MTPSPLQQDTALARENFRVLVRQAAVIGLLLHLGFVGLFASEGVPILAAFNVLSVLVFTLACRESRPNGRLQLAAALPCLEVVAHAMLATVVVGWNTGFHYLMLPLLPVSMLANIRRPIKVGLGLALSLSYLALDAWGDRIAPLSPLAAPLEDALRYSNIVALFVIFALLSVCYLRVISRAQRTLLRLAYTDPLTGAINRRRLLELAQTAMARNKRHTASLSVLLCDMDHFKSINDLHGHDAGDLVLQAFHERVQAVIREVDSLCRWGGEEFLVLLPDTPLGGARQLAERIRQRVQQSPVWLGPPELGVAIEISVTIGVAELRAGEVFDSVVSRADQALYAGKHAGRNRVQTHDGSLAAAGMTAG